ncbi:MAG TPA: hypothetical protein VF855_09745 [Acidimicrobiales bacterium]
MTTIDDPTGLPSQDSASADSFGTDARSLARTLTLTGASGALAGLVVGGIGGRLAMFVLRLTSKDSVAGIESDDGFTIGRFTSSTVFLLLVCLVLGSVVGLLYAAARPALPARWRIPTWTVLAGTFGGAGILHSDGVDFTALDPQLLACALFVAVPALGGLATAWLVERRDEWWFTDRRRTVVASLALIPALAAFPLVVAAALVASLVLALGQIGPLRRAVCRWGAWPVRAALVAVIALSGLALANDLGAIL